MRSSSTVRKMFVGVFGADRDPKTVHSLRHACASERDVDPRDLCDLGGWEFYQVHELLARVAQPRTFGARVDQ
jgi:hypothetical protein